MHNDKGSEEEEIMTESTTEKKGKWTIEDASILDKELVYFVIQGPELLWNRNGKE